MKQCGALTRRGHPCRCPILYPNGRCRMHGGPRSRGWSNFKPQRPDFRDARIPYKRHTTAWNWVSPLLRAPDGSTAKASSVRMLNAGLGALADEMRREPGHQEDDPLICPTTRLEIVQGGGCTNRHFWVCNCGKRVAALYQHPKHKEVWSCMKCTGYTYECLVTSGRGKAKNPERALLQKKKLDPIVGEGRPMGMRQSVYERLENRLPWSGLTADQAETIVFVKKLSRIARRSANVPK